MMMSALIGEVVEVGYVEKKHVDIARIRVLGRIEVLHVSKVLVWKERSLDVYVEDGNVGITIKRQREGMAAITADLANPFLWVLLFLFIDRCHKDVRSRRGCGDSFQNRIVSHRR